MSLKLYEIPAAIEAAVEIDPATGEITLDSQARIDALEMEREKKALHIACAVKSLESELQAVSEEEARLKARVRSLRARAEWYRTYLAQWLAAGESFRDGRVKVTVKESTATEIVDETAIPLEFVEVIPASEKVKRALILNVLRAGDTVPGARLITNKYIKLD